MHGPFYVVICEPSGPTIFFHIISETARFLEKIFIAHKSLLWFALQLLSETFIILRRIQRDVTINGYIQLYVKYRYSCRILTKLKFSEHIFENPSNIKCHKIPPVGAKLFHTDRRTDWQTDTDRQDKANSRFTQFCGSGWKWVPYFHLCSLTREILEGETYL